jgi:hypothetical protein
MFSVVRVGNALLELGLFEAQPLLRKAKYTIKKYVQSALGNSRFLACKAPIDAINDKLLQSTHLSLSDFLTNESNLSKRDSDHLVHFYRIYHPHTLADYSATRYVEEFTGKPTGTILELFEFANPKRFASVPMRSNPNFYPGLVNIWNTMVIMELANIFFTLEFFMNLKCLGLLVTKNRFDITNTYGLLFELMIANKFDNLTYESLVQKYPNTMADIMQFSLRSRINVRPNDHNGIVITIIKAMRELVPKSAPKSNSTLDMKSIFGTLSNPYIRRQIYHGEDFFENFFKYYVVNAKRNTNLNSKFKDDSIEPLIIISDLVMPVKYEMGNEIVIEIWN